MFSFFSRKKKRVASSVHPLTVDLHSHLLPALDDGVQSEEEALNLIRGLTELGYKKFINTPHIYRVNYNNSSATIMPALNKLQQTIKATRLQVTVEAAAEYFFDEYFFHQIEARQLLTFGDQFVLFELPFSVFPSMLEEIIFKINLSGYKPVLAHPERYIYFQDVKLRELMKLKNAGVFFQLNIMSLNEQYGSRAKAVARRLIEKQMIEFAGSDIHRQVQLHSLSQAMNDSYFDKLLASGKLLNETL
ncbi:MAG: tyrosine-protein phosphatase [Chitinophagales bacterium]